MSRFVGFLAIAIGLSGCASLAPLAGGTKPGGNAEILRALGEHLDKCERHYQGSLGLGASFTFNIECPARESIGP